MTGKWVKWNEIILKFQKVILWHQRRIIFLYLGLRCIKYTLKSKLTFFSHSGNQLFYYKSTESLFFCLWKYEETTINWVGFLMKMLSCCPTCLKGSFLTEVWIWEAQWIFFLHTPWSRLKCTGRCLASKSGKISWVSYACSCPHKLCRSCHR